MTWTHVILLVVALHGVVFGQHTPADPDADARIRECAERYFDAVDRRDAKMIDDLMMEECMVFYPRSVVETKATLLAAVRKVDPSVKQVPQTHTVSDVKVRRVGDAAVLTAIVAVKRGDAQPISSRRTLTWVRQGGTWRLLHDQWSLVGSPQEAEFWSEYFRGNNRVFNRKPSDVLVQAVKGVAPGRALDVGVGQGRNAIYLAKQGWEVTGIDPAEGALAVTRQQAAEQGVKVAPILQSAAEFHWGRDQWDLIAMLYVPAVRDNVAHVRDALKPGGLVVIEAFVVPPKSRTGGVEYHPGELRRLFEEGFEILRYEEAKGVADYGARQTQLVRLVARKATGEPSSCVGNSGPSAPSKGGRVHARRSRRDR